MHAQRKEGVAPHYGRGGVEEAEEEQEKKTLFVLNDTVDYYCVSDDSPENETPFGTLAIPTPSTLSLPPFPPATLSSRRNQGGGSAQREGGRDTGYRAAASVSPSYPE
jgi:hypothetical protein